MTIEDDVVVGGAEVESDFPRCCVRLCLLADDDESFLHSCRITMGSPIYGIEPFLLHIWICIVPLC